MVNRSSYHSHRDAFVTTFLLKRLSANAIFLYTMFIFAFSVTIFFFYARNSLDEQQKPLFSVESRYSGQIQDEQLWVAPFGRDMHPCVTPTAKYKASLGYDHYLVVSSNGGLNQMRTGIADMVAVAHMMNATLVIPKLDKRSFWQDSSVFSDIFNEDHFINYLKEDVRIVKELPKNLEALPRARKHFTSWSGLGYYEGMTRLWNTYQVIHVAKSDSRLANNDLPLDIQRLRCRALYQALRFSSNIENLGQVGSLYRFLFHVL